jgi:aromatic-L-amino-acid/L-tryptophan decarboxylase
MAAMTDHLEPDRKTREELTRLFAGYLDDWLDDAGEMDASGEEIAPEALERFRRPPAETGGPPEGVLEVLEEAGKGGIYHPSGGHLSYIPNAGLYTSALGEFVAAGLNRYTGIAGAAPGFVAIEHGVVDWISSLFDIGPDASGSSSSPAGRWRT